MIIQSIQNRIYELRGEKVMLDRDMATLYEIEAKFLNLAVKRNIKRFTKDFMFQLSKEEFEGLRLQIETLEINDNPLRLQNATLKTGRGKHSKYLPYAFTEQGVAILFDADFPDNHLSSLPCQAERKKHHLVSRLFPCEMISIER